LNNALDQSGWKGGELLKDNWRNVIQERIKVMSWDRVVDDVAPFLEKETELQMLTRDNLLALLN
jgi:hypothetical protein